MSSSDHFGRWPALTDEDVAEAVAALRSNRLTQLSGRAVPAFEEAIAAYHDVEHAVAVSTGTAAVHLALKTVDVGPGDEVIVPAHTFVGSASPIVYLGATPVFADVDEATYCLSAASVKELITDRTRAVLVVHLNGCAADMQAVTAVAAEAGVPVIEDAAQALGTRIGDRPVGTFGDLACFSFFEQKVITTAGEGGLVLTRDPAHAARMRRLRSHGEGPTGHDEFIWSHEIGYNYRMTAPQAAVGLSQFRRLDELVGARRANAAYLNERLADVDGLHVPVEPPDTTHAFWKYALRVSSSARVPDAVTLAAKLREHHIPSRLRYPFAVHQQPAFAAYRGADCPVAERLSRELITLPTDPGLPTDLLDRVVSTVRQSVGS